MRLRMLLLLLPLVLALVGCTGASGTPTTMYENTSNANPDNGLHTPQPSRVIPHPTGSLAPGKAGTAAMYPDPALTPGDTFPGVTIQQVCVSGYSKGVRNVTSDEKRAVYDRYRVADTPGAYEVDHFIPLALGGSNALTNLWPEPYAPPPGAHEKDKVEDYLHRAVCDGRMTLDAAQHEIRTDWYAVYLRMEQGR